MNCQWVNIWVSTDNGMTWSYQVASHEPNDGSAMVLMPNVETTNGRIRVEAADNIFFNINDDDFDIVRPSLDAGIPYLESPLGWLDQQETNVTAWLHNYGQSTISNFTVSYTVDGGSAVTENYSGSIAAGDSALHTFSTPLSVSANGQVELCVTISGVTGDTQANNNTYCRTLDIALGADFPTAPGKLVTELFPNPAKEAIQLRFSTAVGLVDGVLLDVLGNVVATQQFNARDAHQTHTMDVSQLRQGTYVLMLSGGQTVDSRRIVVVE